MIFLPILLVASNALANPGTHALVGLEQLEKIGAPILSREDSLGVGLSFLSPKLQDKLLRLNHEAGKCAGFEAISPIAAAKKDLFQSLKLQALKNKRFQPRALRKAKRPEIEKALPLLKEENLRATVEWLSSYPDRDNRKAEPNRHVVDMEAKLKAMLAEYPHPFSVERIRHQRTRQDSLRVHLEGRSRPNEIILIGGHLDSISGGFWGGGGPAPGADDNASGSANVLETLRVMIQQPRPERSVEFFWYAGEESGLLGSSEIAQSYKSAGKDVVAALQLDMTMFPGAGEFVIGNVTDFTSAWLRSFLVEINALYLNNRLIEDRCGYACSDHASWHRQGYPTLMPFESDTDRMNGRIHTAQDTIQNDISFRHSLEFAKIALIFAMDLANSNAREP
jgi:leucyl aminopeptidase